MDSTERAGVACERTVMRIVVFSCLVLALSSPLPTVAEQRPSSSAAGVSELGWPVWPDSTWHAIGHTHGTYQCYPEGGCTPYMHPGIDILVPAGTAVYAISSGYVKYLDMLIPGEATQWCLVIGDSSGTQECDAWAYVHMNRATIQYSVGDTVVQGALLGNIVFWTPAEWHHLHFGTIRSQGDSANWSDRNQWRFLNNALDALSPTTDFDPPEFQNASGSDPFAFAANNTDVYFPSGAPLSGDVDIVCKVHDYVSTTSFRASPYKLEYQIAGDSSTPWINSVCFTGEVLSQTLKWATDIVYQDDATCNTQGDYSAKELYYNVTNTDGDSLLELSDRDYSWRTAYFHNGPYTVNVRAYDAYGNVALESMTVSIANDFELSGRIVVDNPLEMDETVVTVVSSGRADTTDINGDFAIDMIGGGSQLIRISNDHYEALDTVLMMSVNRSLYATLAQLCAIAQSGDVNLSGTLTSADIIFVVNFVFKSGPPPLPCAANGDVNCTGSCTSADIIYMVNHVFKGGPPPCDICNDSNAQACIPNPRS